MPQNQPNKKPSIATTSSTQQLPPLIERIPGDVWAGVIQYLGLQSLKNLRQTSQGMRRMCSEREKLETKAQAQFKSSAMGQALHGLLTEEFQDLLLAEYGGRCSQQAVAAPDSVCDHRYHAIVSDPSSTSSEKPQGLSLEQCWQKVLDAWPMAPFIALGSQVSALWLLLQHVITNPSLEQRFQQLQQQQVVLMDVEPEVKALEPTQVSVEPVKYLFFKEGVSHIPEAACKNWQKLKVVFLPASLTLIGQQAFQGCQHLWSVSWPQNLESIGSEAFADTALQSAELPNTVKTIGYGAFKSCGQLQTVHWSQNLESIGDEAFAHTALQSAQLPESIQKVGANAFFCCPQLQACSLPPRAKASVSANFFSGSAPRKTFF